VTEPDNAVLRSFDNIHLKSRRRSSELYYYNPIFCCQLRKIASFTWFCLHINHSEWFLAQDLFRPRTLLDPAGSIFQYNGHPAGKISCVFRCLPCKDYEAREAVFRKDVQSGHETHTTAFGLDGIQISILRIIRLLIVI